MSTEVFDQFDRHALAVLQARDIPCVRAANYLSKTDSADAETDQALIRWDVYFAQFAQLTDGKCLCCGNTLGCRFGIGLFGGFEWGLAYGEGHCAYCHYPMRGHHCVDDLGTIRNLFLAYHPSGLSFSPKEEL